MLEATVTNLGSKRVSMANRNYASGGKIYSMHVKPVMLDCNFKVAASNVLGITDLKGPMIQSVQMNSSAATPAANNPAAGTIVIKLADNFNRQFMNVRGMAQSPLSGSALKIDNSALTAGVAYVITTLGDATAAKWQAIGVPAGVTPAVGVAFIAASNGGAANTSSSRVQATATNGSGVASIEVVGDPNQSIAPSPSANQGFGAQLILQCYDYAGAKVQPADDTVISIMLYLSDSSVTIGGE